MGLAVVVLFHSCYCSYRLVMERYFTGFRRCCEPISPEVTERNAWESQHNFTNTASVPGPFLIASHTCVCRCLSWLESAPYNLSLIHISEPTRLGMISYAV